MYIRPVIKRFIKHPLDTSARLRRLFRDMRAFNSMNTRPEFRASLSHLYPCLIEWDAPAGSLGYYFWQDLWAAKKIFHGKPAEHYDIGSRVDGFIAHVLSFMPVTMIDIRPLPQKVEGLKFIQADATNLDGIADNSLVSLSSLCAAEHFGMGRYSDPVDPEACFKAMKSMQRVLAHGGHLYLAVPVGDHNGIAFNAHRIFRPEVIVETMNELRLLDFSVANDSDYIGSVGLDEFDSLGTGTDYGGNVDGLFEFVKD